MDSYTTDKTISSTHPHSPRVLAQVFIIQHLNMTHRNLSAFIKDVPLPKDFGLEYQDLPLFTEDGVTLRCYLLMQRTEISHSHAPHIEYADQETDEEVGYSIICAGIYLLYTRKFASKRPTVLMFHGNGGNHGHRIPLARVFFVKMRCNVLMLSYRGCAPSFLQYSNIISHPHMCWQIRSFWWFPFRGRQDLIV